MKFGEGRGQETLGEDVGELGGGRDVEDPNIADGDSITDKVEINLHMFGLLVLHRVGGEVHCTDIVTVDQRAPGERAMELGKELPGP